MGADTSNRAPGRQVRYSDDMLIAAALVGALTAYYFGLRAGAVAAGLAVALFVAALAMPGKALYLYGAVAVGVVGVLVVGPRIPGREKSRQDLLGQAQRILRRVVTFMRRLKK